MDKPISVGDLVMVVRGHECVLRLKGGIPWRVLGFSAQRNGGWHCPKCFEGDIAPEAAIAARLEFHDKGNGIPLSWLKRIPPLDELETVRTEDEVTA